MHHKQRKIVFFPGLGCDARLGKVHHDLPYQINWARWVPVSAHDNFSTYAEKVALTTEVSPDCYLAGISLGGLVALTVAKKIKPRGVILIGSMRSSAGVPPKIKRFVNTYMRLLPSSFLDMRLLPRSRLENYFGVTADQHCQLVRRMINSHNPHNIKRLCRLALTVHEPVEAPCPVISVHGTKDNILNYFEDETDVPLHDAGHLISLTHGEKVNQVIRNFINSHALAESSSNKRFSSEAEPVFSHS